MKFSTALGLAALVHLGAGLILWRSWPTPPPPQGEVVPLELRSAEPPAPPPPVAVPVAAEPVGGGGARPGKRAPRMVIALQPEPGGDLPVAAAPQAVAPPGGGVGTGSGPAIGTGSAATGNAAPVVVDHGPLKAQAMERIRQQRHYPELARRRRLEGTVIVAFRIHPDGAVADAHVKKGVDEMLDQAALEAVKQAAPLPGELASDGELEVLLHFGLTP